MTAEQKPPFHGEGMQKLIHDLAEDKETTVQDFIKERVGARAITQEIIEKVEAK